MKIRPRAHHKYLKYIPLLLIVALILTLYFTKIYQKFSLDWLKEEHVYLKNFVDEHPFLSPLIFIVFHIISVVLIIPDSTILTLLAGYLFPLPLAILYVNLAETAGAYLFFLAVKDALPPAKKTVLKKIGEKFRLYAASYLLFLRFSHILPFWLINSLAAYFKVNTKTFLWTTFVGILPLTIVLVDAGHGFSKIFAENKPLTLSNIFNIEFDIVLALFALLALVPVLYKWWKKRK